MRGRVSAARRVQFLDRGKLQVPIDIAVTSVLVDRSAHALRRFRSLAR